MASKHSANNNNQKNYKFIALIIIVALLILAIYFMIRLQKSNTGDRDDRLIGTWTTDEVTVYEFDGKGNGRMLLPSSEYKYTYVLNNNKIYIDFESDRATDSDYEYSFDGDKLILKGIKATTGVYTFTKK